MVEPFALLYAGLHNVIKPFRDTSSCAMGQPFTEQRREGVTGVGAIFLMTRYMSSMTSKGFSECETEPVKTQLASPFLVIYFFERERRGML